MTFPVTRSFLQTTHHFQIICFVDNLTQSVGFIIENAMIIKVSCRFFYALEVVDLDFERVLSRFWFNRSVAASP